MRFRNLRRFDEEEGGGVGRFLQKAKHHKNIIISQHFCLPKEKKCLLLENYDNSNIFLHTQK